MGGVMLTRWLCALAVVAATLSGSLRVHAQGLAFDSAAALQKSGNFEAAAAEYRRFLDAYPQSVEARSNLGVVLMQLGRYEEAIAAYQTALVVIFSLVFMAAKRGDWFPAFRIPQPDRLVHAGRCQQRAVG